MCSRTASEVADQAEDLHKRQFKKAQEGEISDSSPNTSDTGPLVFLQLQCFLSHS